MKGSAIFSANNSLTGAYLLISLDADGIAYSVFDPLYTPPLTIRTHGVRLTDGQWHHIVHIINRPPEGTHIYVDGVDRGDMLLENAKPDSAAFFRSAWNVDTISLGGGGVRMDDFAIWDIPLTRQQVVQLTRGRSPHNAFG